MLKTITTYESQYNEGWNHVTHVVQNWQPYHDENGTEITLDNWCQTARAMANSNNRINTLNGNAMAIAYCKGVIDAVDHAEMTGELSPHH